MTSPDDASGTRARAVVRWDMRRTPSLCGETVTLETTKGTPLFRFGRSSTTSSHIPPNFNTTRDISLRKKGTTYDRMGDLNTDVGMTQRSRGHRLLEKLVMRKKSRVTSRKTKACVGWYGAHSWSTYAEGYLEASEALVRWLRKRKDPTHADRFLYPVAFLARHAVELRLKELLIADGHLNRTWASKTLRVTHDLWDLWRLAYPILQRVFSGATRADLAHIGSWVAELNEYDSSGFSFRYPLTRDGKSSTLSKFPKEFDISRMTELARLLDAKIDGALAAIGELLQGREGPTMVEPDDLSY